MKNAVLFSKIKEALTSVLPIALLVVLLGVTITPLDNGMILQFLVACVFVVLGIAFFTIGADTSMMPIGQNMGSYLSKKNKIWLTLLVSFVLGALVTFAEPDLKVLAETVPVDSSIFTLVVSVGVGLFLAIGVLRILFKIKLNIILTIAYSIVFLLVIFLSENIIPVSFDSGSVTTGPISVPFIMAFGLGLAAVRGQNNEDSGFGMIALSSAGPILAVMLFLLLSGITGTNVTNDVTNYDTSNLGMIFLSFFSQMPAVFLETGVILFLITAFFMIFQIFALKLPKNQIWKIFVGILWTFFGISFFLVGVMVGFLPVGTEIGKQLGNTPWLLILICAVLGFAMMAVEPAVQVLNKQIETITNGAIKKSTMFLCIASGVSVAVALCAIRVITGISILWILVPCYALVIVLSFFTPKMFTGIAFDSGGVATGAMATTFAFPLIKGACETLDSNLMTDAFGCLGLIATAPIVTIQILGIIYKIGERKNKKATIATGETSKRIEIMEFD